MPHALPPRAALLLAALAALSALATALPAARSDERGPTPERVVFATSPALSPTGDTLFFSWRGDLWRAPSTGGAARRLTVHPAPDSHPQVSPDGTRLAFVSTRSGSAQVWWMPVEGGRPTRVTSHTESCSLEAWFPDGHAVLIRQARDHDWRAAGRLFRRPLDVRAPAELLFDAAARSAAISPDGTRIAFTREGVAWTRKRYRGSQASQVWIHDLEEGTFEKITRGDHGEHSPLWTPDGKHLLIVSQQDGTFDLWRHDLETGAREALTRFEDDGVLGPTVSADGSTIVFRRLADLWRLSPRAGTPPRKLDLVNASEPTLDPDLRRVLRSATAVAFTADAREIAFVSGGDLWVMDTELREPRQITRTSEEEREPLFSPDGETLVFVRDLDTQADVWTAKRADPERYWWQNDAFVLDRVTDDAGGESRLAFTPDGTRLAVVRGEGDLWWMKPDGSDARRLVQSWSPLEYSFSPDGRWIAYAASDADFNRDVWILPTDLSSEAVNVSMHPDDDGSPAFSPDGKLLAFTGRHWDDERDICYVWLREKDEETSKRDRLIEKALKTMKGRKKKAKAKEPGTGKEPAPQTPPSEDAFAGTWQGRVLGDDLPDDGMVLTLVLVRGEDGTLSGTAEIPDLFSGRVEILEARGQTLKGRIQTPLGEVGAVAILDGETLRGRWTMPPNRSGTFELGREAEEATPAEDGDETAKEEEEETTTKKKKKKAVPATEIDLEDISERIHRVSIPHSVERALVWMGTEAQLGFSATVKGVPGFYTLTFPDALTPKKLAATTGHRARWLPKAKALGWLVGGKPATLGTNGKSRTFAFEIRDTVSLSARHAAAFDLAWRTTRDTFYDPRLGGRDWDAVRTKYRPLAEASLAPQEIQAVINLMLGELNGSHLGFNARRSSWSPPGWREETGHLGLRFDREAPGDGLRVREVIEHAPADRNESRIRVGERVLEIDGTPVDRKTNLARLLTGDPKRDVVLKVRAEDEEEREVVLRPTSTRNVRRLLYHRWLAANETRVAELSKGRLGYLHVRGMNWSSFHRFEEALYEVGHGRDGLIIDVRNNGGGFTADHLLTSLTQPMHAFTVPRGGAAGYPQDRMVYARWTKPIVVLINQNSFSNAEIFAHAIRTLKRGRLVGVPTAGGVISTSGTNIMDVGSLRLPFRGWFTLPDGEDMEQNGCVPDVLVWPRPGDTTDRQLEAAVTVLLEEVSAWKKLPPPRYASGRTR